ncbi:MAG: hypothetical protein IPK52_18330 [Chloroflexi bacterium]|nr:hypothetical protein [Chloroflexota bacterium]
MNRPSLPSTLPVLAAAQTHDVPGRGDLKADAEALVQQADFDALAEPVGIR